MRLMAMVVFFATIFRTVGCQLTGTAKRDSAESTGRWRGKSIHRVHDSIRQWLGQHRPVAAEIDKMCAPARANAPGELGEHNGRPVVYRCEAISVHQSSTGRCEE